MVEHTSTYVTADIPDDFKGLRACLRCSLIKTFAQFLDNGCENCEFLGLEGDTQKTTECTTSYFTGMIAMVEPDGSWVAKWQRIGSFQPGVYAIEMLGELPEHVIEFCVDNRIEIKKSNNNTNKQDS